MNSATEAKKLLIAINEKFKRVPNTIYKLWIANNTYHESYDFFIQVIKCNGTYSYPLYKVENYDLNYLEDS